MSESENLAIQNQKQQDFSTSFGGALAQELVIHNFCALNFRKTNRFAHPCVVWCRSAPLQLPSPRTPILSDNKIRNPKVPSNLLAHDKLRATVMQVRSSTEHFRQLLAQLPACAGSCGGSCASVCATKATTFLSLNCHFYHSCH